MRKKRSRITREPVIWAPNDQCNGNCGRNGCTAEGAEFMGKGKNPRGQRPREEEEQAKPENDGEGGRHTQQEKPRIQVRPPLKSPHPVFHAIPNKPMRPLLVSPMTE